MADEKDPHAGVTVKMSNGDRTLNCSLAVSVICDSSGVQVRACIFDVYFNLFFHGFPSEVDSFSFFGPEIFSYLFCRDLRHWR